MSEKQWVSVNVEKDTRTKLKILAAESELSVCDLIKQIVDKRFKERGKKGEKQ